MAVQPDGKIVVGGALYSSDARLARLNADGSLDTTFNSPPDFGSNTNVPGYTNVVSDLALQIDGKILVAGNFLTIDGSARPYVGRLIGDPTGPPFILNQPKGQTVMEGQSVSFSVVPAGALPVTYQWLFNSAAIPGATNANLNLENVRSTQAGSYSVKLLSANGETTSVQAALTVLPLAPPVILAQPINQIAIEGATVNFSVTATNFLPLAYQWRFNGLGIGGATNSTLTLANVRMTNAGIYSVIVSTELLSVTNSGASLSLQPSVVVDPGFYSGPGLEILDALGIGKKTSVVAQPDGRIIVTGHFLSVSGVPRNRIRASTSTAVWTRLSIQASASLSIPVLVSSLIFKPSQFNLTARS
jgi:hypothetical protein